MRHIITRHPILRIIAVYAMVLSIAAVLTVGGSASSQEVLAAAGGNWGLTGNAGTDPNIDALGTLDAQPLVIKANAVEAMRVAPGGFVGIGTANPTAPLHIYEKAGVGNHTIRVDATVNQNPNILFSVEGQHYANLRVDEAGNDHLQFQVYSTPGDYGSVKTAIDIAPSGNVGVRLLEITGGSDLAEPFEVAAGDAVEPGMVVAIDPTQPGQLRLADSAYDYTVAGVVSGANGIKPGLVMQQEGSVADGEVPVALSGRVYVWADAAYGAIQPGDLLTTSDTPGHAMKVVEHERAQGAILGKAMSSLAEGRGFVLVLISLQ
jgi:hypothetical protein